MVIAFIVFLAAAPNTKNDEELETTTEFTTETTTEETTTTTVTTTTTTTSTSTTTETTTVEITTEAPTSAPVAVASSNNYSSSYSNSSSDDSYVSDDNTADTVYIVKTGTIFHSQGCRTLKGNGSPISLSEAKAQGREACKVSKP